METDTEPNDARAARIRVYSGGRVQDVKRTYRAPAEADLAEFLKRCALAVLPKAEGWRLLVVSVARTEEFEAIAPVLDRLARRLVRGGARDFAAALAVTADGSQAALAVATKDAGRMESLRAALTAMGR